MNRSGTSLVRKLFAVIAMTALLVVLIMAAMIAYGMREGFSLYLLRGEAVKLEPLARSLAKSYDTHAHGWPQFQSDPDLWDRMIAEHVSPNIQPSPPPPPDAPAPPSSIEARLSLLDTQGRRLAGAPVSGVRSERVAINVDGVPVGWLSLAEPDGARSQTDAFFLRGQFLTLALAAVVALMFSGGAAFVLARQFLSPIRALADGAKTLAEGDYAARIPNERDDELGLLIDHYNELARSLEAAEIAERQWMSDTSHEFQTPLAVLRANIEAIQDGVRAADEKTLAAMHDATLRLARLVEDLRTLSRNREAGAETRSVEDLAVLVREAADAAAVRFAEAGLELVIEAAAPAPVACDRRRMRQVLDNLLENALRYTDAPGQVEIGVRETGDRVVLTVQDSPPVPPQEAMDRLFDRFYRAEASRSRAHGGSGLGLSICKAVVHAHDGQIRASRSDLGGLKIEMTLPRSEGEA